MADYQELKNSELKSLQRVDDRWIFLFVYPAIALSAVHLGNDNSFKDLLQIPSYYTDLLLALGCTYMAGIYLRWLYLKLNISASKNTYSSRQVIAQAGLGIFLPTAVIMCTESVYLIYYLNIPLYDSSIHYLELPLTILFLLIVNFIYTLLYHRIQTEAFIAELTAKNMGNKTKEIHVLVDAGAKTLKVSVAEVAYFSIQEGSTFIITHDDKKFLFNSPLERINEKMTNAGFFRLNRQVLASRSAITGYERTPTRKLLIQLMPAATEPVYVAKNNIGKFKSWVEEA